MKLDLSYLKPLAAMVLVTPAAADVIYSNLKDITIPATYDGVYLNVETGAWNTNRLSPETGWDLNAYQGGAALWNSPDFQPVRSGTGSLDSVLNLGAGILVDSSSVFSTYVQGSAGDNPGGPGYGGSETHLGAGLGQFAAGTEGYLGFKLNGTNYGWMRVVFTNNTGDALIKDWAYDTSGGAAIATGNVLQDGSTVTLDSSFGSFTLASQLSGSNSLVKTGSGTATLTATNTYTGATQVENGTLVINGSTSTSSIVTVAAGTAAAAPVAVLGGIGIIGGNVILAAESASSFKNGGVLAPTAAASGTNLSVTGTTTFNTGSIFAWSMSATTPEDDPGVLANSGLYGQLAGTGAISGSDAVFNILLGAGNAFTDAFWNSDKSWTNLFTGDGATASLASIFSSIGGEGITYASGKGLVTGEGYFTFNGTSTLNWTAVPEPTSALAGILLAAGLLRRRPRCSRPLA